MNGATLLRNSLSYWPFPFFFLSVPKYHKKTFSAKLKSTRNPPELILNLNNMPGEMKGG